MGILNKTLSAGMDKQIHRYEKRVKNDINPLEEKYSAMTSDELRAANAALMDEAKGEKPDETKIVNEGLALMREVTKRTTGKRAFDVQLEAALALWDGNIAEAKTGEGKACLNSELMPTPEGFKKVGDIRVGDIVFGSNGEPTTITGVFPQKEQKQIYLITLKDGRTIKCSGDHIWHAANITNEYKFRDVTTNEMYTRGVKSGRAYRWHLPMNGVAQYDTKSFKIDPYVMGAFLGDGCKNLNGNFQLSSNDESILDEIRTLLGAKSYHRNAANNFNYTFYLSEYDENLAASRQNHPIKIRDVAPEYETLLSSTYAHEKHIPTEYKQGSVEQRWALIQGLMDTDGNIYNGVSDDGHARFAMQYWTTSPQLRDDFLEVVYSLGFSATWTYGKRAGNGVAKHDQYVIRINCDNDVKPMFFRLPRKKKIAEEAAAYGSKRRDYSRIAIKSIEKLDEYGDMTCFTVDAPDHLFLVGQYIVTHNTIVSHFPQYLGLIHGQQVHQVTVNEYLAKRDHDEAASIFDALGFKVGYIYNQQPNDSKREAYACNVVYGTPSEFGFDYLRDNMVQRYEDKLQKEHSYAIIDEIDSILIDEARTPLIISGPGNSAAKTYTAFAKAVKGLERGEEPDFDPLMGNKPEPTGEYVLDEAKRTIAATEKGLAKIESRLGFKVYADATGTLANHLQQALKAEYMFHRDKDYIVIDGEVKIVDENTGRIMEGRRWSDGLHQAIEAKEHVEIQEENQTLATVTLQNFFRLYDKLCGMTGTALTEDAEFRETYNIGVIPIPTNRPMVRKDADDLIYRTTEAKYRAIADEIAVRHANGQPILVGTTSVENSMKLSALLRARGIKHNVLNAKEHEKEAAIVAEAGRLGAVTIATNMAGRGTDIALGGNVNGMRDKFMQEIIEASGKEDYIPTPEEAEEATKRAEAIFADEHDKVLEAGGLCVIGTERHDSRRIDNQLRGRAGRQGDPGFSRFYISLEDDLMRIFGGSMDRINHMMVRTGIPDDMPLEAKMVSKAIENAQRKIETMNKEMRKHTLEYDDVVNSQRLAIYKLRDDILQDNTLTATIDAMINELCDTAIRVLDADATGMRKVSDERNSLLARAASGETIVSPFPPEKRESRKEKSERTKTERDERIAAKVEEREIRRNETKFEHRERRAASKWDVEGFKRFVSYVEGKDTELPKGCTTVKQVRAKLYDELKALYQAKRDFVGDDESFNDQLERPMMLGVIDNNWIAHLSYMDYLKSTIWLRGYAQRDPAVEYKIDGFQAFRNLQETIDTEYVGGIIKTKLRVVTSEDAFQNARSAMRYSQPQEATGNVNRTLDKASQMNRRDEAAQELLKEMYGEDAVSARQDDRKQRMFR